MTAFVTHPACLAHEPNPGHPECPERLYAILSHLEDAVFAGLHHISPAPATDDDILLAHTQAHLDYIENNVPPAGINFIDDCTYLSPRSAEAARYAAGAVLAAAEAVLAGREKNAFCAVRPPGHHAAQEKAGNFCLYNNVAIGALAALARHGLTRVAIVDFDVHHGDGTQDIVWDREGIFFCSLHRADFEPFTGHAHETGAHGNVLNVPLGEDTPVAAMLDAIRDRLMPRLESFAPQAIFVSAGVEGPRDDPSQAMALDVADYAAVMRALCDAAARLCDGRLIAVLEGGYDLRAMSAGVAACLRVMMEAAG